MLKNKKIKSKINKILLVSIAGTIIGYAIFFLNFENKEGQLVTKTYE